MNTLLILISFTLIAVFVNLPTAGWFASGCLFGMMLFAAKIVLAPGEAIRKIEELA